MADGTNGNGSGWKTFGIVAGSLAGIYLLVSFIKGTFNPANWFASSPAKPAEGTTPPAEGSACQANGMNGIIVNGVCTPVRTQQAYQIEITKQPSAPTYTKDAQGNFIAPKIPQAIPFGTVLTVIGVDKQPASYYNTSVGWISANDAQVLLLKTR